VAQTEGLNMQNAFIYGFIAILALTGCAPAAQGDGATAPEPSKPIDAGKLYTGTWYEIARTPMHITDGCVAGTTEYLQNNGKLIERDACRMGTPEGKEKSIQGPVRILNPGLNSKIVVHYTVYGIIPISRTYWLIDRGDDYQWFIFTNPAFTNVSIFTRAKQPGAARIAELTTRLQSLGYDPKKLEFPTEFPTP
jgi:apolipoprotein D and lipocalin family protein